MKNNTQTCIVPDTDSIKQKILDYFGEINDIINFKSKLIISILQSMNIDNFNLFKKSK